MKNTNINLKAINNTSVSQPISLFGVVPNQNSANNANSMYSFDMSSVVYNGIDSAIITYTSIYSVTPTTIKVTVLTQSIAGVVEALNTLNIGLFNFSGTTIYVSSNTYSYSNLIVGLPFVSTWDTSNISIGSSANNQIALPLDPSGSYDFVVDWGDGNQDTITSWNQAETLHTYSSSGVYTISIFGLFKGIYFNNTGDKLKILSISNWGSFELIGNSGSQFYGCSNLDLTAVYDVLNFGNCTNCSGMFIDYQFSTINNIDSWDVSSVTNMINMFQNSLFNQSINSWDVSSVTNMTSMFLSTPFNQNIGSWNVGNVLTMNQMFQSASSFNQDISAWDVSSVTNMSRMFTGANSFNQNISSWVVSSVTDMNNMFQSASSFNQPLNSWNVSNVTDMSFMFSGATLFNQNISTWDVSSVTNMASMFAGANSFNQPLNSWSVSNVTDMSSMFSGANSFNQNISTWDVSNVVNMSFMFSGATLFNQNISTWDVSNVVNMSFMFSSANSFNQPLNSWNVTNVTNMFAMFISANSFNQPLNSWDVSNVVNLASMFAGATSFNQNITTWNVSNVVNMGAMFAGATVFNQNISGWNVSNVISMSAMFSGATAFNQNIGSWNISNVSIFDNFMLGKTPATFSTTNLDAIYNDWSLLSVQPNINITFGTAKYTAGASAGRAILTSAPNNWTITDGGI